MEQLLAVTRGNVNHGIELLKKHAAERKKLSSEDLAKLDRYPPSKRNLRLRNCYGVAKTNRQRIKMAVSFKAIPMNDILEMIDLAEARTLADLPSTPPIVERSAVDVGKVIQSLKDPTEADVQYEGQKILRVSRVSKIKYLIFLQRFYELSEK